MADVKSDPNCAEPACKSKVDMFKSFMGGNRRASGGAANAKTSAGGGGAAATENAPEQPTLPEDCPLGREELGNATWGLVGCAMHSKVKQ
jgi:hypothetical protein